ncbi:MAG: outer membrane protein assembly factor BamB family protein [Chitinophagaceae bacterium]
MRYFFFGISIFTCLIGACTDSTSYFRKLNVISTSTSGVFDRVDWRTQLDGPVRSSVASDGNNLYIGTTKGSFYNIDPSKGTIKWTYKTSSINSTAAYTGGKVYFTNIDQSLICLNSGNGKKVWSLSLGKRLKYDWGFDNYFSSPVIHKNLLFVGSADGNLYSVETKNGRIIWKFHTGEVIRGTPVIDNEMVYFGDVAGNFYAVYLKTGKLSWKFKTRGNSMDNARFGFDRKAIISSAAVSAGLCVFGSRDGSLYGINKISGDSVWRLSYQLSWVISSPVIKDSMVIVGTSDAKFVNAVNLFTGKEVWKFPSKQIVWGSAIIINDEVYIGDNEGIIYILNYRTGAKVSELRTNAGIFSSPVFNGQRVVFGNDEGYLYALKPGMYNKDEPAKYVYWQTEPAGMYYKKDMDVRLKNYLTDNGFKLLDSSLFNEVLKNEGKNKAVIIHVNGLIPGINLENRNESFLRKYLDEGGKLILTGINPVLFDFSNPKLSMGLNAARVKLLLGIDYGPDDLRSARGVYAAFATAAAKKMGMPPFWLAAFSLEPWQVNEALGFDENGLVSSWKKNYNNSGRLIQVWVNPERPEDYGYLKRLTDD